MLWGFSRAEHRRSRCQCFLPFCKCSSSGKSFCMNPTGAIQRGSSFEKTRERRKNVSYSWEEVCAEGKVLRMSGGRSCPFLGGTPGRWCIPQQIIQCCTHLRLPASLQPDGDRVLPAAVNWTGTVSSTGVTSVQRIFMSSEGGQCAGTSAVLGKGVFH